MDWYVSSFRLLRTIYVLSAIKLGWKKPTWSKKASFFHGYEEGEEVWNDLFLDFENKHSYKKRKSSDAPSAPKPRLTKHVRRAARTRITPSKQPQDAVFLQEALPKSRTKHQTRPPRSPRKRKKRRRKRKKNKKEKHMVRSVDSIDGDLHRLQLIFRRKFFFRENSENYGCFKWQVKRKGWLFTCWGWGWVWG